MGRYSGVIGIKGSAVEVEPGVFKKTIIELPITGSIFRRRMFWSTDSVQQDQLRAGQTISFVAPSDLKNNASEVVYATFQGRKWTVTSVDYKPPRIEITLGGLYVE